MISTKYKFIFVHLPKTGGNSIQNILRKHSDDEIVLRHPQQDGIERFDLMNSKYKTSKHSTLQEYQNALENRFHEFFKFICVRNPWERMISAFFTPEYERTEWNRDLFIEFLDLPLLHLSHYLALTNCNSKTCYENIDFILMYETLEEDFQKVCKKINVEPEILPHRNRSNRKHYTYYYDEELKELVYMKFKDEIDYFGYDF